MNDSTCSRVQLRASCVGRSATRSSADDEVVENGLPISWCPSQWPSRLRSALLTCRMRPSTETSAMPIEACVNALWKRRSLSYSS